MTPADRKLLRAATPFTAWVTNRNAGRVVVSLGTTHARVLDRIAGVIERALKEAAIAERVEADAPVEEWEPAVE